MSDIDTKNKNQKANDNNEDYAAYMECLKDAKKGESKAYHSLAKIYELGLCGVDVDIAKAIEMRKTYIKAYRKHVPVEFNIVTYSIETGNMYLNEGNKFRAAECFMEAILLLQEQYDDEPEEMERMLSKYELKKLLKETGHENIV